MVRGEEIFLADPPALPGRGGGGGGGGGGGTAAIADKAKSVYSHTMIDTKPGTEGGREGGRE